MLLTENGVMIWKKNPPNNNMMDGAAVYLKKIKN